MARPVLPAVTGLRGVAAGVIVLFHVEVFRRALLGPAGHTPGFNHGWAAVDLFFVLSAFLLAIPFVAGHPPAAWLYAWRRFARVVPPYWASIPVALAINAVIGQPDARWRDLWTHATFLHALFPDTITSINSVYWTLAVEAQIYLVLPILARLLRGQAWALHTAWMCGLTFAVRALSLDHFAFGVASVNLPGFLVHAVVGVLAARAFVNAPSPQPGDRFLWLLAAVLIILPLVLLVPPASFLQGRETWAANLLVRPALGIGIACAILASCRSPAATRWLGTAPLAWLGSISYSLFLLHLPLLALAAWRWGAGWGPMLAGVAASVVAAVAFHAAIERPSQHWAQASFSHRGARAEPL